MSSCRATNAKAIDADADKRALMACVLDAIEKRKAEDYRLCAFVATQGESFTYQEIVDPCSDSTGPEGK